MDAVLVGLLTALTVAFGTMFWYLLVRPDVLVSRLHEVGSHDGFFDLHPGALRALRWTTAGVLFLLGFLTGLATAFLSSTAS